MLSPRRTLNARNSARSAIDAVFGKLAWTLDHYLAIAAIASFASFAAPVARAAIERPAAGPALLRSLIAHGPVRIRVRIAEGSAVARVRGLDIQMYESATEPGRRGVALRAADREKREWELRCQDGRVRAMTPDGSYTYELKAPVSIHSAAGLLNLEGKPYRGELRIHPQGSLCEVVNVTELEKYLIGLVNAEFSSKWSEEATGAQVVAARTYALHQILVSQNQHYDVESDVYDQAYAGFAREDYRASRIVRKTAGLVLTSGVGPGVMPIKAFYHSTCGGHTVLPQQVWGVSYAGFKRTVACPFCARAPKSQWELDLDVVAMGEAIKKGARRDSRLSGWPKDWERLLKGARLIGMHTRSADPVNLRVSEVTAVWNTRSGARLAFPITANQFRGWIGASKLKSTSFELLPTRAGWRIAGRGNGHGVGMCQWGAKVMGERGFKMGTILGYYYPDAAVRKMW